MLRRSGGIDDDDFRTLWPTREAALAAIAWGRNSMSAFRASYSDQQLHDLAAYMAERLAPNNP